MKYRALTLVAASMLILVAGTRLIYAQQDCGNGLPCGSIPWPQPNPPQLQSPTPMPTVGVTQIPPTQTPGGPTATPAPSSTAAFDSSGLNDQVSTLGAVIQTTPLAINDINGTPVNTTGTFDTLGVNAGTFFGYARGISQASFGQMSPLFDFGFLALIVVISIKLITFLLPIGSAIFGVIRGVIALIRSLNPL